MTKLKEYLFFKNISVTSFAKELRISRTYLSNITTGRSIPSRLLSEEIERRTNGEVKSDSFAKPKSEEEITKAQDVIKKDSIEFEKLLSEFKENVRHLGS